MRICSIPQRTGRKSMKGDTSQVDLPAGSKVKSRYFPRSSWLVAVRVPDTWALSVVGSRWSSAQFDGRIDLDTSKLESRRLKCQAKLRRQRLMVASSDGYSSKSYCINDPSDGWRTHLRGVVGVSQNELSLSEDLLSDETAKLYCFTDPYQGEVCQLDVSRLVGRVCISVRSDSYCS